jgi:mono/diheme cytochrome c family protein
MSMKYGISILAGCLLIVSAISFGADASARASKIARGKYLVEGIGMCGDCHTPHDEKGEPVAGKLLKGAPLFFKPNVPVPNWADKTSTIAGLPGWEDDAAVKFFMTGIAYNDLPARPPMPRFRFNKPDAEAVVAYLKSLAPADK